MRYKNPLEQTLEEALDQWMQETNKDEDTDLEVEISGMIFRLDIKQLPQLLTIMTDFAEKQEGN